MQPPHKGKVDTYLTREGCEFRIMYVRSAFYTVKCYPFTSYYLNIRKQPTGPYKESLFQVIFTLCNKALILQHLWSVNHFGKNTSRLAISFTLTIQSKTFMRISGKNRAIFNIQICYKSHPFRSSLVAQWLRIRLPMQGTQVQSLVQEDPTSRRTTKPVRHNYWARTPTARAPQQEKPHHSEKPMHLNEE